MSVLADCADAVVTALGLHTFSPTITPVRSWNDLAQELTDDDLHVDVVGVHHPLYDLIERGGVVGYETQVAVGVRQRFGIDDQDDNTGAVELAEVDALVGLLETIADYLTELTIGTASDYEWKETKFLTSVVHKWLRSHKQYTGILLITYTHAKNTVT